MEKRQYHEVFGFMPQDIINRLSEDDRRRLFVEWILRKPTEIGWFITRTVIAAMGDDFIKYLLKSVVNTIEEDEKDGDVDKETVISGLQSILESFATDINSLYEFIEIYLEDGGKIPKDRDQITSEMAMESKSKVLKRDAKGRFIKKK